MSYFFKFWWPFQFIFFRLYTKIPSYKTFKPWWEISVVLSYIYKLYFFPLVPCSVINLVRRRFKYRSAFSAEATCCSICTDLNADTELHTPHGGRRPLRFPFTAVCCWKLTLPCTLLTQTWRTRPSFFPSSPFLLWSRNESRVFAWFLIRRQLVSTLRELDRCNDRSGINMDSSGTCGVAERD